MKFYDMEVPTSLVNKLPILFNMPEELLADIVYLTNTVEERETSIFVHCLFFYISKKYKLKSFDAFINKMEQNSDNHMADFIEEITRRMLMEKA
jgi:hypothetical protein